MKYKPGDVVDMDGQKLQVVPPDYVERLATNAVVCLVAAAVLFAVAAVTQVWVAAPAVFSLGAAWGLNAARSMARGRS